MQSLRIKIFWPSKLISDIYETRFSYDFCRDTSYQVSQKSEFSLTWVDYRAENPVLALSEDVDVLLMVTDPELVLSAPAVSRLSILATQGSHACGPVFNYTTFPLQLAPITAPYLNVATFYELAEVFSQHNTDAVITAPHLDAACIAIHRDNLNYIDWKAFGTESILLPQTTYATSLKFLVDTGALVHRFGPYYFSEREELVQLVPQKAKTVLDVGCAFGGYGKTLKRQRPDIHLTGVEMNPVMATAAHPYYDRVITGRIEDVHFSDQYDWINCGDVVEHCPDPWSLLQRLHDILHKGGGLLISVPNAGHWTVVKDLMAGTFQYLPVGLQCITHLRWFTESSLRQAVEQAGFSIGTLMKQKPPPTPEGAKFIRNVCDAGYGNEDSLTTNQFTLTAFHP